MKNELMERLRIKPENERTLLETELQSTGIKDANTPGNWVPASLTLTTETAELEGRASEISDFEDRSAVEAELEHHYNTIIAALERIAHGTYGYCRICRSMIEEDGLEANPAAETCKTHLNN